MVRKREVLVIFDNLPNAKGAAVTASLTAGADTICLQVSAVRRTVQGSNTLTRSIKQDNCVITGRLTLDGLHFNDAIVISYIGPMVRDQGT